MRYKLSSVLIRTAREAGARDLDVVRRGKHPKLVGQIGRQTFKYTFPCTPGDRRTEKNCVSQLRRLLAVRLREAA